MSDHNMPIVAEALNIVKARGNVKDVDYADYTDTFTHQEIYETHVVLGVNELEDNIVSWAVQRPPANMRVSILRTFHGGKEEEKLDSFAHAVIQDEDTALEIAKKLLDLAPGDDYEYNEDDPFYYERFRVIDRSALIAQIEEMEAGA